MPNPTTLDETIGGLVRLLAGADQLVYAVAGNRTIVYANAAVAEWLGVNPTGLVGRGVAYHSAGAAEASGLLTGLCPPPEALAGAEAVGTISCVAQAGGLRHRRARCVPLGDGGVLVVGESCDLTTDELAEHVAGGATDSLRLAIQRFRAERSAATAPALLGHSPVTQQLRRRFDAAAAAGCNALVVGSDEAERRGLAEALHHAANDRVTASPATLLPIDFALTGVDEANERIAASCARHLTTPLLLGPETLDAEQQAAVARGLHAAKPKRVLAAIPASAAQPTAAEDNHDGQESAVSQTLQGDLDAVVATVTLRIPPLTDRAADLPLLFQWFVEQQNTRDDKQLGGLTEPAVELLAAYPFRDLAQVEQMVADAHRKCRGARIDRGDLPRAAQQAAFAAELSPPRESADLDQLLADVEREVVTRALVAARDNKAEAARLLGLTRQRFYRLLDRLGLLEPNVGDAS